MSDRSRTRILHVAAALCFLATVGSAVSKAQTVTPHSGESVQQVVTDVLADPEYRHLHEREDSAADDWWNRDNLPEWLRNFLDWLLRDDNTRPTRRGSGLPWGEIVYYGMLTALAVAFIALVVAILRDGDLQRWDEHETFADDAEAIVPTQPPGDVPTNEYERRALAAAQAGDFRGGLRELVLGSMSWVERSGLVRYRRGLTNRDYVRAVWRMVERRDSLLEIVAAFERVFYGRRLADEATFENCLAEFRRSFLMEANDAQPSN